MPEIIDIVSNVTGGVVSAGTVAELWQLWWAYILWTCMLCMPLYLLLGGPLVFGMKWKPLKKGLNYTVRANIVLALLPIAIPAAIAYLLGRVLWWAIKQFGPAGAPRPRGRGRP